MAYYPYSYYPSSIIGRIVNTIVGLIGLALGVRFVLQLLGASTTSGFVAGVYSMTQPLVAPFIGMFPAWNLAGFVIDFSTIVAMFAYSILGWLVMYVMSLVVLPSSPYEYERRV